MSVIAELKVNFCKYKGVNIYSHSKEKAKTTKKMGICGCNVLQRQKDKVTCKI